MKLDNLQALYIDTLKDLYSAESQLLEALPKMAKAAHSAELRSAFEHHKSQSEEQRRRIEEIFSDLDHSPAGKKCQGMEGIIAEAQSLIDKRSEVDPDVFDAALIAKAQHAEHYEIAGYGTAATWADQLGRSEDVTRLRETIGEEERTDQKLTMLATTHYNKAAQA